MPAAESNWAGSHTYGAVRVERPATVEALREVVAREPRVRALGTRHTFSDVADTAGVLVDLGGLPPELAVDPTGRTVSLGGGVTYGVLAEYLESHGLALANLASLPHISVAGAVATGTHGSGHRVTSLAAQVVALEVVGPEGEVQRVRRGDAGFEGWVVSLGALGVVTRLELAVEPTYRVRQQVLTGLTWAVLEERFDEVVTAAHSVSLFTRFDDEEVAQLWVKGREDEPAPRDIPGTAPADGARHMLPGGGVDAVTTQGGVPGPWLHRLPHFRLDATPSNGSELQSEYFVAREDGVAALAALRRVAPAFTALLQVCEVRTVAADDLWLSGASGRETVAFHFTWVLDEPAVRAAVRVIEEALAPFTARPHWGKVFELGADALVTVFPRLGDFAALRREVDPQGVFANDFLGRVLPD